MSGRHRWWDRDEGSALVEIVAILPVLVIAALVAVQMQLFVSTAVASENAARNASRAMRDGGDPHAAATHSLSSAEVARLGPVVVESERVTVTLTVPSVLGAVSLPEWTVERSATIPQRASSEESS